MSGVPFFEGLPPEAAGGGTTGPPPCGLGARRLVVSPGTPGNGGEPEAHISLEV